mmetsp:Transcript_61756/g.188580  ORF Transcript_61756/g.188580 Transcript_61756/m.188580 type:complete len:271 (+) Transcript_61756:1397-2209(+)
MTWRARSGCSARRRGSALRTASLCRAASATGASRGRPVRQDWHGSGRNPTWACASACRSPLSSSPATCWVWPTRPARSSTRRISRRTTSSSTCPRSPRTRWAPTCGSGPGGWSSRTRKSRWQQACTAAPTGSRSGTGTGTSSTSRTRRSSRPKVWCSLAKTNRRSAWTSSSSTSLSTLSMWPCSSTRSTSPAPGCRRPRSSASSRRRATPTGFRTWSRTAAGRARARTGPRSRSERRVPRPGPEAGATPTPPPRVLQVYIPSAGWPTAFS